MKKPKPLIDRDRLCNRCNAKWRRNAGRCWYCGCPEFRLRPKAPGKS